MPKGLQSAARIILPQSGKIPHWQPERYFPPRACRGENDLNFSRLRTRTLRGFSLRRRAKSQNFPRMKTAALRQANLKKEAAAVEDYWSLFLETGAPEFYMLYRAREDEKCRENKEKPSPMG